MNAFIRMRDYFIQKYSGSYYVLQRKAVSLLVLNAALFTGLLLLLAASPFLGRERIIQVGATFAILSAGVIGSLIFLRAGRYYVAANITIGIIVFAVAAGLALKYLYSPHAGYTSYMQLMPAIIIGTALFSTTRAVTVITLIMTAFNVTYFILVQDRLDALSLEAAKVGLMDNFLAVAMAYILTISLIHIMRRAIEISDEESGKNREQYGILRSLLETIKGISVTLFASSSETSSTARSLSDHAQNQAATVEEMSASLEEVAANVENINRSTDEQFASLLELIREIADLSCIIDELKESSREISDVFFSVMGLAEEGGASLNKIDEGIREIIDSSDKVASIVTIMDEFFDRIRLLALNATIEAARAGDLGKGFAVVAEEISKLSDRSSGSLKEISVLVERNTTEVGRGSSNITEAINLVREITSKLKGIDERTSKLFRDITRQMDSKERINSRVGIVRNSGEEIKNSMREQKAAIDEVVRTISGINEITQSNAAAAEEMATGSHVLADVSEELNKKMDELDKL